MKVRIAIFILASIALFTVSGKAQGRGQAPATGRAAAPSDFTGYWVSVVTEDWRWRMVTPAKGDYDSVPLNAAGRREADAWDPQRDEANGEACRAYAAPAIMRVPGRIHVTWDNDAALRIEAEAGTQTRVFRFGASAADRGQPAPTWQGESVASW